MSNATALAKMPVKLKFANRNQSSQSLWPLSPILSSTSSSSSILSYLSLSNSSSTFPSQSKSSKCRTKSTNLSTKFSTKSNKISILIAAFLLITTLMIPTPVTGIACYICEYNINFCKDPRCFNNPDICSANSFSSVLVPIMNCPRNCMLKAVTNPAGIVLKWKRLCAPASDLTRGFNCRIDYVFGARIEQCTCDKEYCNHGSNNQINNVWIVMALFGGAIYWIAFQNFRLL